MISERVKAARQQNRMSQSDLAKKLGVTRSSVNAWEMGISVPSTQYLVELTKTLKVTADYLLGLDANLTVNVEHLDESERKVIFDLLKTFEKLSEAMSLLHENNLLLSEESAFLAGTATNRCLSPNLDKNT